MYEARYPAAEDLVVVQVKNVAEMGAYVSLLEYDNIEGTREQHAGNSAVAACHQSRAMRPPSLSSSPRRALV
jgi:hypothetical protein